MDITGKTECSAALQSFLQPTDRRTADIFGDDLLKIDFPKDARVRVNQPVVITRPIYFNGNGCRIFCDTTTGLTDFIRFAPTAVGSVIENVRFLYSIAGIQSVDNDKKAIKVECRDFTAREILITGCGFGIWLDNENESFNLNKFYLEKINIRNVRRIGVKILGTDASAGMCVAVKVIVAENHFNSINNFGPAIAFYDGAANGTTWIGCHHEVCNQGFMFQPRGGLAPTTVVGMYCEDSDPVSMAASPEGNKSDCTGNIVIVGGHMSLLQEASSGTRISGSASNIGYRAQRVARNTGIGTLTFTKVGSGGTIRRNDADDNRDWIKDKFAVNMQLLYITNTVSNNLINGSPPYIITGVTADTLSFTTANINDEIVINSAPVRMFAVGPTFSGRMPDHLKSSALSWSAGNASSVDSKEMFLLKRDAATAGTSRWTIQPDSAQSQNLLGVESIDLGSGSFEGNPIIGADKHQDITGSGNWNGLSKDIYSTHTATRNIHLINAPQINWTVTVYDDSDNAGTHNITFTVNGTIRGTSTISSNSGKREFKYRGSGNWIAT